MKDLFRVLPAFAPDYSGVCTVIYEMGGICVTHDGGGCIGHTLQIDETRWFIEKKPVFTSNLREIETATGDDEKIVRKLIYAMDAVDGRFLVLAGTPVPMMTGFDYKAVARIVEKRTHIPCIGINTSGYRFYDEGQSMTYMELLKKFGDNPKRCVNQVNVIGATQLDMWDKNSVAELRAILREAGVQNVTFWGADAGIEDIAGSREAKLNIVVSNSGLEAGEYLKEHANVPYLIGFPVGKKQKECFVSKVKSILNGDNDFVKQDKYPVNRTEYNRVLIVGEYISSDSIRQCLEYEYGIEHVDVGSFFRMPGGLVRETDIKLSQEEDFIKTVKEGHYDLIIADVMYKKLIPEYKNRYLENPHMGISGIIYLARAFNYVGEKGTLSFDHYFNVKA